MIFLDYSITDNWLSLCEEYRNIIVFEKVYFIKKYNKKSPKLVCGNNKIKVIKVSVVGVSEV